MPKTNQDRHLKRLPEKSFKVAPGDVVGGMIYIMDKPLGVEEGMIGLSIDSQPYRDYIQSMIELFQHRKTLDTKAEISNPALENRYNELVKLDSYSGLSVDEQNILIDLLIHDPKIQEYVDGLPEKTEKEKARKEAAQAFVVQYINKDKLNLPNEKKSHPLTFKEVGRLFRPSQLHKFQGGQNYYINNGMGGLILNAYQQHCGVTKKEHFASKIQKIIYNGKKEAPEEQNDIYMVKQDGELRSGNKTGPGFRKRLKTTQGQKQIAPLLHPGVILVTGGLSALAGYLILRATSRKSSTLSSNTDAITETVATKIAEAKGMKAQDIETIDGTYENGAPKVATIVKWSPGCRDLSGRLKGSDDLEDVITVQSKHGEEVRVDSKNNLLVKRKDKDTKKDIYEKVVETPDGIQRITISKKQFEKGQAVAEDRIAGLGESLISMLSAGDRDGMGKKGQNKAIVPLHPPVDNQIYQFYGIDYGKAYIDHNPIIRSLSDDFSFQNLKGVHEKYVNYSAMYDNPLREKMKGVYLLAALRGKYETAEGKIIKDKIIAEFKASSSKSDQDFADKLSNCPKPPDGKNADITLLSKEAEAYRQKAKDFPENAAEYLEYAKKLDKTVDIINRTDGIILETFEQRMKFTPSQIDVLENMEKLTAKKAHVLSPNKKVQLNHIRVESKDRIAWQFNKDGKLVTQGLKDENIGAVKTKIEAFITSLEKQAERQPGTAHQINNLLGILKMINFDKAPIEIPKLEEAQFKLLHQFLNEENVAATREDTKGFRTQEKRDTFHKRLKALNEYPPGKKATEDKKVVNKPTPSKDTKVLLTASTPSPQVVVRQRSISDSPSTNPEKTVEKPLRPRAQSMPEATFKTPHNTKTPTRPVGLIFSDPISDTSPPTQNIAVQSQLTLDELNAYLNTASKEFHQIEKVDPPQRTNNFQLMQTIHFKDPKDDSNKAKVYAQKSQDSTITYATDVDLGEAAFKYAVEQTCRLAVFSAQNNAEFTISPDLTEKQQNILRTAFETAIKEASTITDKMPHPPFDENTKPTVKGEEAPRQKATL